MFEHQGTWRPKSISESYKSYTNKFWTTYNYHRVINHIPIGNDTSKHRHTCTDTTKYLCYQSCLLKWLTTCACASVCTRWHPFVLEWHLWFPTCGNASFILQACFHNYRLACASVFVQIGRWEAIFIRNTTFSKKGKREAHLFSSQRTGNVCQEFHGCFHFQNISWKETGRKETFQETQLQILL